MLPNLGQVSENQRQFSNRLLCSRRSFVRDNRNGLLNTGELWSVTSGRMEKLSLSLKRMGRRPALPVSHADWCEPWPRRARPGPLHEMPGRARLIDDLTLKSWVKIWLWVQIPALPHMVPKPQACDPNAQCLSFLLCQTRVTIGPTLSDFYEDCELPNARWFAQCLARSRHYFIGDYLINSYTFL